MNLNHRAPEYAAASLVLQGPKKGINYIVMSAFLTPQPADGLAAPLARQNDCRPESTLVLQVENRDPFESSKNFPTHRSLTYIPQLTPVYPSTRLPIYLSTFYPPWLPAALLSRHLARVASVLKAPPLLLRTTKNRSAPALCPRSQRRKLLRSHRQSFEPGLPQRRRRPAARRRTVRSPPQAGATRRALPAPPLPARPLLVRGVR